MIVDALGLQEPDRAVRFKVRDRRDIGYDEVTGYLRSPSTPRYEPIVSKYRSTSPPPLRIMYVSDSPLSRQISTLIVITESWA